MSKGWRRTQRAPAPTGRPQQKKEKQSPVVQQPKKHHSGEIDEGVVCRRWFVARSASSARKSREGKDRGFCSRTNPCVTRRGSCGSSGGWHGDCSSGARRVTGEISVGGSFAEGQEGSEVNTETAVVRSGSCSSAAGELAQARHNLKVLRSEASETAVPPLPPPHAGEVEQLRAEVAKLRMEKEDVKCSYRGREIESRAPRSSKGESNSPQWSYRPQFRQAAFIDDANATRRCVVAHHIPWGFPPPRVGEGVPPDMVWEVFVLVRPVTLAHRFCVCAAPPVLWTLRLRRSIQAGSVRWVIWQRIYRCHTPIMVQMRTNAVQSVPSRVGVRWRTSVTTKCLNGACCPIHRPVTTRWIACERMKQWALWSVPHLWSFATFYRQFCTKQFPTGNNDCNEQSVGDEVNDEILDIASVDFRNGWDVWFRGPSANWRQMIPWSLQSQPNWRVSPQVSSGWRQWTWSSCSQSGLVSWNPFLDSWRERIVLQSALHWLR